MLPRIPRVVGRQVRDISDADQMVKQWEILLPPPRLRGVVHSCKYNIEPFSRPHLSLLTSSDSLRRFSALPCI